MYLSCRINEPTSFLGMKLKSLLVLIVVLISTSISAQLMINEVCASNYTDYTDNYGEYEDWIEIYNAGGAAVDLNGYYFSDDSTDPLKYQVTASVSVPAGGYRVIFASNRNQIAGNNIHTSFKINQQQQEYAVLSDPSGTTIDLMWLDSPTQANHSRGRVTDGASTYGVFTNPTPGAANSNSYNAYAAAPLFDIPSGEQGGAINVNVTSSEAGVTVRYDTNGTFPSGTSTVASGAINVAVTTVVHARAYSTDPLILPSFMETNTYLINENHTVDVISISGPQLMTLLNGTQISPVGHFEYFGSDGLLKDEAHGDFNEHGNDSWAYDQRGFDYITRDQMGYNDEIHHPIFRTKNRQGYQRLIVKAAANDNYPFDNTPGGGCHIIDSYVHSLSQIGDLRIDERSYEACILYVNGEYWGVYDVREKVDDLDFTDYYYNQGEGEVDFIKTWGGTWNEFDSGTAYEWDELVTFITTNDMTDAANYNYVKSVLNTGSLIDYFVLNSYIVTTDWLNWNTGWWRGVNPNGEKKKWRFILWDNDASFGQYVNFTGVPDITPDADPCNAEELNNPGGQGHTEILTELMTNEEFYNDYVSRYADLTQTYFSCDFMVGHLDSLTGIIAPEMQDQVDRWGGTYAGWEGNVDNLRDWMLARCVAFEDGMVDCYDIDGPYPFTVQVMPPGAGWVEFNTIEMTEFPWNGVYYGNLDVELHANAYGINTFSHWESNNHVLADFSNDTTDFTFAESDTIIAWFVTETSDVILDVEPDGAGSIDFFGSTYNTLPSTVTAPEGIDLDLATNPNGNFYVFDHWELENHTLDPDVYTDEVEINIDTTDYIVAYYNELDNYNVTFLVEPSGTGAIIYEGVTLNNYPYNTGQLLGGEDYTINALEEQYWIFDHWELSNTLTLGDSSLIDNAFTLNQNDVVTAIFREQENHIVTYDVTPRGTGQIRVDGQMLTEYPTTIKYYEPDFHRALTALPEDFHDLSHWTIEHNVLNPDDKSEEVTVELMYSDTIVAHFVQQLFGYYLPSAFSPNGDGINDIYHLSGNAIDVEFYSLQIFDRNGLLMFETNDISQGWNGSARGDSNYYAQDGVYVYRLKVRSVFDNNIEEVMGNILLTR